MNEEKLNELANVVVSILEPVEYALSEAMGADVTLKSKRH